MQQKTFNKRNHHSYYDVNHRSLSSSYIRLNNMLTYSTTKHIPFKIRYICSFIILFLFIFFLSLLLILSISTPVQKTTNNHRLKRQIILSNIYNNDKQHCTNMLRRILQRTNSSVLADCTINMAIDGIYHLPLENSLSSEIIRLVEIYFHNELNVLKRTINKILHKIKQPPNYFGDFALAKFRDNFSIDIRLLLASQLSIKQINVMVATPLSNNNNNSDDSYVYYNTLKYYRINKNKITKLIYPFDYDSIHDVKLKQTVSIILQTFTPSNARETLKQTNTNHSFLIHHGWWIGPVLCERNQNETFLMAHIFPFTNSYFFITYFNISSVEINQCTNSNVPFGSTHKCPIGTKCVHQVGRGFTLGAYECQCSDSNNNSRTITGNQLEWNNKTDNSSASLINTCLCSHELCRLKHNRILRTTVAFIQLIFIIFVVILAVIIFQRRKIKIIKHSMWILLELVLFGAILLYTSIIVDSFGSYGIVCLIMPWLRELGFTIVYGTLILRIYKMLAEFQSRKAHCVQVKEKDILRILFFISISIIGYLLGWTFVNIDHSNEDISLGKYLLGTGFTRNEKRYFQTCRPHSWDYLVQFAEFIFLCVGVRFIYSTRTAPCEYHERKLITIAIVCEMFFSTLLHIIKDCLWSSVHPDSLFILSVLCCHFTVTCMLMLIFCTKLCYIFRPFNEDHSGRDRFRSVADGIEASDLVTKLHSNGDVEFDELNLRDMDPEEIRAELKRLYTSLHVLKTKTMRKNNPHLTKRHGPRRKHRRFSMQTFQRHGGTNATNFNTSAIFNIHISGDKHEHEQTKTPEDSTGSHTEPPQFGGISIYRGSIDENDDAHEQELISTVASAAVSQRVTFK